MYTEKQLQFNRYRNELKETNTHTKRSHYQDLFNRHDISPFFYRNSVFFELSKVILVEIPEPV